MFSKARDTLRSGLSDGEEDIYSSGRESDIEEDNGYSSEGEDSSDNGSVGSSDSALWREGERANARKERRVDELREAFEQGNPTEFQKSLNKVEPEDIDLTDEEIREKIIENDDEELFEIISNHETLYPHQSDADKWIEGAIQSGCSKLFPHLIDFFKVSEYDLMENITDCEDKDSVRFCLNYLLRDFSKNPKFRAELEKCLDIFRDNSHLDLRIITAMQYESMRHNFNSFEYKIRLFLLGLVDYRLSKKTPHELFEYLHEQETAEHDYFGSNLSDDSDDELSDTELPAAKKAESKDLAKKAGLTKVSKYLEGLVNEEEVTVTEKNMAGKFPPIAHTYQPTKQARKDKDTLNLRFKEAMQKGQLQELLNSLQTRFAILYFRGVSYYTTLWNKPARKHHRDLDEIARPLFSSAAYNAAGISINQLRSYTLDEVQERVTPHAQEVTAVSEQLRAEKKILYKLWNDKKTYANALYLFHEIYTTDYDSFPNFLRTAKLPIEGNPLVSTGQTPRHPENYALGNKVYNGHEDKRLRPRWNNEGRCERPYSGKVYSIMMPLVELASTAMVSIPQLNYQGHIFIDLQVIAERETSFWGMVKPNLVVGQMKARYPSFHLQYNPKYLEKYGLTRGLYEKFQSAFTMFAPHTDKNKLCKRLLGTYLSAFYEVRAIDQSVKTAVAQGFTPIFYTMEGNLSFSMGSDSPNRNGISSEVKEGHQHKRSVIQRSLSSSTARRLDFSAKLDEEDDLPDISSLYI